jgi:hypothetical protein
VFSKNALKGRKVEGFRVGNDSVAIKDDGSQHLEFFELSFEMEKQKAIGVSPLPSA